MKEWKEKSIFNAVDIAFASYLDEKNDFTPDEALFSAFIMLSARLGHMAVHFNEQGLLPDPKVLGMAEAHSQLIQGASQLRDRLLKNEMGLIWVRDLIGNDKVRSSFFYLQRNWALLSKFIDRYRTLNASPLDLPLDDNLLKLKLEEVQRRGLLQKEQANAVEMACSSAITILTGGPGTGKTYTACYIIQMIREVLDDDLDIRVILTAPTGKAVQHLRNSLLNKLTNVNIESKTVHALLGYRRDGSRNNVYLDADLVIVDEASMIDLKLMTELFSCLKPGGRLVLMGDPNQLPPVDCGALFSEICHVHSHVVRLNRCIRVAQKEMIDFSQAILHGTEEQVLRHLELGLGAKSLTFSSPKDIVEYAAPLYLKALARGIEGVDAFRLFSPLKRGPYGCFALNERIFDWIKDRLATQEVYPVPIIVTSNDYNRELFNGEIGLLYLHQRENFHTDYALFSGERKYAKAVLPPYEYAFCLSVHKSQGSEFEHVLLLLPAGSESFGKEVLYTAVTRAKSKIEIWGENDTIKNALKTSSQALCGLSEALDN